MANKIRQSGNAKTKNGNNQLLSENVPIQLFSVRFCSVQYITVIMLSLLVSIDNIARFDLDVDHITSMGEMMIMIEKLVNCFGAK